MKKTVRSRAPLRLGFAGGGTDVSPYCDQFGGCVLNATIDLYAHCTIVLDEKASEIQFDALDMGKSEKLPLAPLCSLEGDLRLHRAAYNRVVRDFNDGKALPVRVFTWSDAPPGSGLGTSSTVVVAILAAYVELLSLPLGEYDIAHLAYEIERLDCGLAGGKQDQYAATFGGFNFMEFYQDNRVIVNPLRIRRHVELELEASLLLYFTGQSRESAKIIDEQAKAAKAGGPENAAAIDAMHEVKATAFAMKEAVLKGDINSFHKTLGESWDAKKRMAASISTTGIEQLATLALGAGAKSIKVSGAGGGGFMMIFVDPVRKPEIVTIFNKQMTGGFHDFRFTSSGVEAWKV